MDQDKENLFSALIKTAMDLTRLGAEQAKVTPDHKEAFQLLTSKQVRLRLVIEFNPVPAVIAELIREDNGELAGELFTLQGRMASVN